MAALVFVLFRCSCLWTLLLLLRYALIFGIRTAALVVALGGVVAPELAGAQGVETRPAGIVKGVRQGILRRPSRFASS